jgi:hypothetical protein
MLLDPIGGFVYATIYMDGVICPIATSRLLRYVLRRFGPQSGAGKLSHNWALNG